MFDLGLNLGLWVKARGWLVVAVTAAQSRAYVAREPVL